MLDFLACQSVEKLVVDAEAIGMVKRLLEGMRVRTETLATAMFEGTAGFLATVLSNHVRGYDDMLRLSFSQEAGENHFAFYLPTHKATYRALGARSIQNISCALYDIYDSKDYRSDGVGSGVDRVDDTANNVMRDIHRTNHDLPWRALLTLEEAWVRHLDRLGWEGDEVLRMNGIDPNF